MRIWSIGICAMTLLSDASKVTMAWIYGRIWICSRINEYLTFKSKHECPDINEQIEILNKLFSYITIQ